MFDRSKHLDQQFLQRVKEKKFPAARSVQKISGTPDKSVLVDLFESQIMSRHLDFTSRDMKTRAESYYTIGSCGHEGNAALGALFQLQDMCFLHYRSGAFMVQRAKQLPGQTPLYDLLLSFAASSEDPISGGRHKVFGSLPLLVPPQTSTIASHLPKAVGAAFSIPRAQSLKINSVMKNDSVVMCSFGDASANHSTSQGAFNSAAWCAYQNLPLPLVFVCEDNGIGISVHTPHAWIENSFSNRVGLKYFACDGLNLLDVYRVGKEAIHYARTVRRPVFLHLKLVRLLGHAGSDIESTYHSNEEMAAMEWDDPLLHSARLLVEENILTSDEIISLYEELRARITRIAKITVTRPKLRTIEEIKTSVIPTRQTRVAPPLPSAEMRTQFFAADSKMLTLKHHMAKLINWGLQDLMLRYPQTLIFGEDVAKKGGVYNVTAGLFKKFGPARVFNTLLDEQTIIGLGLGLAHNGFLPIPEIQFLAYVHNAEDQIRGEAATLPFFSEGRFLNPMVLRIPGLAYQKGFGGHFHNDNSLAVFRDIPGLIIAVPSHGADAVKMMRSCVKAAYEYGRVVIFLEPIALYMTRDLHQKGDDGWCFEYPAPEEEIALGDFAVLGEGKDLLIITYGNGTYYSMQAVRELSAKKIESTVIDLRWIAPLNEEALVKVAKKFKHILVVDECRKTGSLSENLVAMLAQKLKGVELSVLAAEDCFIPLGEAAASGLPKKEEIVAHASSFLGKSR